MQLRVFVCIIPIIWYGILFPKLFWPTERKNVLVIDKKLLAEGQKIADFSRLLKGIQDKNSVA